MAKINRYGGEAPLRINRAGDLFLGFVSVAIGAEPEATATPSTGVTATWGSAAGAADDLEVVLTFDNPPYDIVSVWGVCDDDGDVVNIRKKSYDNSTGVLIIDTMATTTLTDGEDVVEINYIAQRMNL